MDMLVNDRVIKFTVSIGVGEKRNDELSFEQVMARADKALYQAKEQGRNRVVVSDL